MSQSLDWLPHRREQQIAMAKNWCAVLKRTAVAWSIPPAVATELAGLYEVAEETLAEALSSSRTAVITARCKEAFDLLVGKMRDTKRRYFLTPPLTDSDYISLGLKEPDTIPTIIPPPSAQVEADLTFPGIHLVELKHIRAVAGVAPDARSDYGVRVFWGLSGAPNGTDNFRITKAPNSGYDLPHSQFTRRRKERFDFDGESGNTVYFCLRYENPKGQTGPFGPILKAVIP